MAYNKKALTGCGDSNDLHIKSFTSGIANMFACGVAPIKPDILPGAVSLVLLCVAKPVRFCIQQPIQRLFNRAPDPNFPR